MVEKLTAYPLHTTMSFQKIFRLRHKGTIGDPHYAKQAYDIRRMERLSMVSYDLRNLTNSGRSELTSLGERTDDADV